jgi:hypothetical protein
MSLDVTSGYLRGRSITIVTRLTFAGFQTSNLLAYDDETGVRL